MRFFFKSRQFKIIAAVVASVLFLTLVFGITGARMAPQTDIFGWVMQPLKAGASKVREAVSDIVTVFSGGESLMIENAELTEEISELKKQLAEYEEAANENEIYKKYLGIKDANPDFTFVSANVIAKDSDDPYCGFTVNKGSMSGIKKYDPVITDAGVVGYITEVGLTFCKVTTVLNPKISLGAIDNRSGDSGVITSKLEFAKKGVCAFKNLSRTSAVAVGDYVSTSGEGVFPEGLLIGSIEYIGTDSINSSVYAEIKPFNDINELRNVMVITSFDGQITAAEGK